MTAKRLSLPQDKSIWGWALYDWANSAFATTVMAGFFPIFFKQYCAYGANVNVSTARLGFANAIAGIIVALLAPVLGAMADAGSRRKSYLLRLAFMGALSTFGLFFLKQGQWQLAVVIYILGVIGFSGANVFYDALLPAVAKSDQLDKVSSFGFALGYLGGGLLFLINVLMTLFPHVFGLPDATTAVRVAFVTVAVWWAGFSLFTLVWVREPRGAAAQRSAPIGKGLKDVWRTLRQARQLKTAFTFLLAYWFYIDGVDTVIRMAVDYGMSLGFSSNHLIVALLIVQFVGFPAALAFGWLGRHWGVRKALFLGISVYMVVTLWGTMMTRPTEFYLLAVAIGMVQGGVQALSRSYYARLIPLDQAAQFYGFYNMLGKFAAIIGPALMAVVGLLARGILMPAAPSADQIEAVGQLAARWSMGSILVLFAVGALLLYRVNPQNAAAEIRRYQAQKKV